MPPANQVAATGTEEGNGGWIMPVLMGFCGHANELIVRGGVVRVRYGDKGEMGNAKNRGLELT